MSTTTHAGDRRLSDVRVMRAMHPGVVACSPGASVRAVARLLAEHSIHAVVVFLGGRTARSAWGVVSALDVAAAAVAGDADAQTAASIAVSPVSTLDITAVLAGVELRR